jgi:WD40 repeat protein
MRTSSVDTPIRAFLCHSSGDKEAVRALYRRLREDDIEPWLDEEEILPGQDWEHEIAKAVRSADVVIVCLSNESVTKTGYVQKEIRVALDVGDQQPEGVIFIIPLKLEECDIPARLRRWHWVNYFEAHGYERLLRALRRRGNALTKFSHDSGLSTNRVFNKELPDNGPPAPKSPDTRSAEAGVPGASAELAVTVADTTEAVAEGTPPTDTLAPASHSRIDSPSKDRRRLATSRSEVEARGVGRLGRLKIASAMVIAVAVITLLIWGLTRPTGVEPRPAGAETKPTLAEGSERVFYKQVPTRISTKGDVKFSPDGRMLAIAGEDGSIRFLNAQTGVLERTFGQGKSNASIITFSPDGETLVTASDDDTLKMWDVRTGALKGSFPSHGTGLWDVQFSHDCKLLATAGADKLVKLWDVQTGALKQTLAGHTLMIGSVAFSPDDEWLASGSWDMTVKLWDVRTGALRQTLRGHGSHVNVVAISLDGRTLASGSSDYSVRLWNVPEGTLRKVLPGDRAAVFPVEFSPDGKLLAVANMKTLELWDVDTGERLRTRIEHSDRDNEGRYIPASIDCVAFSSEGRLLATGSKGVVNLWDVRTNAHLQTLEVHAADVFRVEFSADGKVLLSKSEDGDVKLWQAGS